MAIGFTEATNKNKEITNQLNLIGKDYICTQSEKDSLVALANSFISVVGSIQPDSGEVVVPKDFTVNLIYATTGNVVPGGEDLSTNPRIRASDVKNRGISVSVTPSSKVGSIKFGLNGKSNIRVESKAPYTLGGDDSNNRPLSYPIPIGVSTLTITSYDKPKATGKVLKTSVFTFNIYETPAPLSAPSNLEARFYENESLVELIWTDTNSSETGYEIQLDPDSSGATDYSTVATTPPNASTFEFPNSSWDVISNFSYRVRAIGEEIVSPWSNVALPVKYMPENPGDGTIVEPGFNFTGKTGSFIAKDGTYPNFEPESDLHVAAMNSRKAIINIPKGQQWLSRGAKNCNFKGLIWSGGGKDKKLNDNAAVMSGADTVFDDCEVTGAWGVGICLSDRNIFKNGKIHDNGSAGYGTKGADIQILDNEITNNNWRTKDGDGGCKGTRSLRPKVLRNHIHNQCVSAVWFDINNGGTGSEIAYNTIHDIRLRQGSNKPWEGYGIKLEINKPGWDIHHNTIYDVDGASISVEETHDVSIHENSIQDSVGPQSLGTLQVRDLARSDGQGSEKTDWVLGNINFFNNKSYDNKKLTLTVSGAGNKISMAKYNINVHDNFSPVDNRIPK